MSLRNDRRPKTQGALYFPSSSAGEAREAEREEPESFPAEHGPERLAQPLESPCTDPYAQWCGRGRRVTAAPMPINIPLEPTRHPPIVGGRLTAQRRR